MNLERKAIIGSLKFWNYHESNKIVANTFG